MFRRYRTFIQSVNICAGLFGLFMFNICSVNSSPLKIFWRPCSLLALLISFGPLYIPYPAVLRVQCPLISIGSLEESSV